VSNGRFSSDPSSVSARMRRIHPQGTKPELRMAAVIDSSGFCFREQIRVAGVMVDFIIEGGVVLFVDSPFWHLRDIATLRRLTAYWQHRLLANRRRDRRQTAILRASGYTVLRVWADQVNTPAAALRIKRCVLRSRRRASLPSVPNS
jgi:DNA mismatch endonuclease, patch repair protein